MPERAGKYKTKGVIGFINPVAFEEIALFIKSDHRGYFGDNLDWRYVTHWMPLTEPSREGE